MKPIKVKTQCSQPLSKQRKDSDKQSPSTASPHSPGNLSSNQFKSCQDLWTSSYDPLDAERLALSVCAIEGSQEEMKARFDKMVEFLEAQIARNNEENRRLAEEVAHLGREVRDCNQDIKTIEGMLRPRNEKRDRAAMDETSLERGQSRISSHSASRRMLLNNRSNQRPHPSKRISSKLFMGKIKL